LDDGDEDDAPSAVSKGNKRKRPFQPKLSHEEWLAKWSKLDFLPCDLRPSETEEHGMSSWTVHNKATGARVEVLFVRRALVVKSCPVAAFLAESRRKDGGLHVPWTAKGDLKQTWSWLKTEIGWQDE
jgi:hypothetical protein